MTFKINQTLFDSKIQKTNSCWIWTGNIDRSGYGYFGLQINGKQTAKKTHRIVYALANNRFDLLTQPFDRNQVVMHQCNNKLCCNPSHLSLGTQKQNSSDAANQGLYITGERHPQSKLTQQQVQEIRTRQYPYKYYAAKFSVSISLIQKVSLGVHRRHD